MTKHQQLYNGVLKTAWAYFFLYFDINIQSVSILPSFIGYILFLSAINDLSEEERELKLLYTSGVILAVWQTADWLAGFASLKLDGMGLIPILDILITVINLYFHFQLLTNLASIATKYQAYGYELDQRLLHCRTFQTIVLTASILVDHSLKWLEAYGSILLVGMIILYLIAGILLMKALFDLSRQLKAHTGAI